MKAVYLAMNEELSEMPRLKQLETSEGLKALSALSLRDLHDPAELNKSMIRRLDRLLKK